MALSFCCWWSPDRFALGKSCADNEVDRLGFIGDAIFCEDGAMNKRQSPEFRERAVRIVLEHQGDYTSQWATINSLTAKVGYTSETWRN